MSLVSTRLIVLGKTPQGGVWFRLTVAQNQGGSDTPNERRGTKGYGGAWRAPDSNFARCPKIQPRVSCRPRSEDGGWGSPTRLGTISPQEWGVAMKRTGYVVILSAMLAGLFVSGFCVGVLVRKTSPVATAQAAACALETGDVDGSKELDLSDAVYILSFLFLGREGPVQFCSTDEQLLACRNELEATRAELARCRILPATGQVVGYDDGGRVIPCPTAAFPNQDGCLQAGCPMKERFVDHGNGTVSDRCTGLMWAKVPEDVNGDEKITTADQVIWKEALRLSAELPLAEERDWRLPNINELLSLIDYGRFSPSLDPVFGDFAANDWYWSSTTLSDTSSYAWMVNFTRSSVGHASWRTKGSGGLVVAVRDE